MAHALPQGRLTVDDLYRLPADDGLKHELESGFLVSEPVPGARHGYTAAKICQILVAYVEQHDLGAVFGNDTGYLLARSPDTVRGPDVSYVERTRLAAGTLPVGPFSGPPDLAVEVLSPSNTRPAIRAKVADYIAAGTRLVWVIDPESRSATVYRSLLSPRDIEENGTLDGEDVLPGLRIELSELFWGG
jgi:Uma2 family endonuclease